MRAACIGIALSAAAPWVLAIVVPHFRLTRSYNAVGSPDKPAEWLSIYEYSRPGMVRREWFGSAFAPGPGTPPRLDTALRKQGRYVRKPDFAASQRWGSLRERAEKSSDRTACIDDGRGWPALAAWCEIQPGAVPGAAPGANGGLIVPFLSGTGGLDELRVLPCRPIWRGVFVNAAWYAAAMIVLSAFTRAARRAIRRFRGRCAACGYNLAGVIEEVCPECGERVG